MLSCPSISKPEPWLPMHLWGEKDVQKVVTSLAPQQQVHSRLEGLRAPLSPNHKSSHTEEPERLCANCVCSTKSPFEGAQQSNPLERMDSTSWEGHVERCSPGPVK